MAYSEIENLKRYFGNHQIQIKRDSIQIRDDLFYVNLSIDGSLFRLLVDDEYLDYSKSNKLMNWFLVLNALELYKESEDLFEWSRALNIDPAIYINYYRKLNVDCSTIESIIGKIDACIRPLDYQLRTGVIEALKQHTF